MLAPFPNLTHLAVWSFFQRKDHAREILDHLPSLKSLIWGTGPLHIRANSDRHADLVASFSNEARVSFWTVPQDVHDFQWEVWEMAAKSHGDQTP